MSAATPASGTGRCLCGAVRFAWDRAPLWSAHCHCESCRRACSAPFASFFALTDDGWRWTAAAPARFRSSAKARRWFCPACGSPMAFAHDDLPGETHFYAASMDRPETYVPTEHDFLDEKLPWVHLADGLPPTREARR
jgi:hypothetical protein